MTHPAKPRESVGLPRVSPIEFKRPESLLLVAPNERISESLGKRLFDVVASAVLLVALSPLFVVLACSVKLTSPGPVFFRQRRAGLGGRSFTMLKFRSMSHGASEELHREYVSRLLDLEHAPTSSPDAGAVYKLTEDDRVTAFGQFLRRTSLDELPQFLNVLAGDMSLVGPRPPLHYEVALYQAWQMERMSVRPGISGLWQVSGRNQKTYVDMCALDIQYIRDWTLWGDFVIAARTPFVVLFRSKWTA